jgi:hypothetical protein
MHLLKEVAYTLYQLSTTFGILAVGFWAMFDLIRQYEKSKGEQNEKGSQERGS